MDCDDGSTKAAASRTVTGYLTLEEVQVAARQRRLRLAFFLTALPLELAAVRAHLKNLGGVRADDGTIFECGTFSDRGQEWLIVVGETRAGTHNAQQVVSTGDFTFRSIGKFELMIFVGIGGSRKKGSPIGSVVAAEKVYYPYGGKYTEGMLANRPTSVLMDHELINIAQKVSRDEIWPSRILHPRSGPAPGGDDYPVALPPSAKVAPIASIEAVLDDPNSPLEELLKSSYSDTHVVEMEGYGAVFSAHTVRTPGMIIRGVSDMTKLKSDEDDDILQPIAAAHAAAFAFEVLSHWGMHNDVPQATFRRSVERADASAYGADGRHDAERREASGTSANGGMATNTERRLAEGVGLEQTTVEISVVLNISADFGPNDRDRLDRLQRTLQEIAGNPRIKIVEAQAGSLLLFVADPDGALIRVGEQRLRKTLLETDEAELIGMMPIASYDARKTQTAELYAASSDLLKWPTTLPDGERLERPELDTLAARLTYSSASATALIGPPGAGKSALLATLGKNFVAKGWPVLAIKADLLDPNVSSEADLRNQLGLPANPSDMLQELASFGPVLLIVDQLDALAGYVDIKTARLSILLNLVRRLGRVDNVHIVLSSRVFEFQHDVRLRAVDAESISLELPPWSEVLGVLDARGVAAAGWPADAQEVMRSPQALATYLLLSSRYSSQPFNSYQLMLDRLWTERVLVGGDAGERDRLASDIANAMAEQESLWLAAARFSDRTTAMQALVAAGVLTTLDTSVGFSHQTLFEFTLARSFAREPGRLSTFAVERQDSLFLRPKLWAGLTYLRGADPDIYHGELEAIWRTKNLRAHLRALLIDFLGSQSAPTDREALLMETALAENATCLRAFKALAGSPGWFDRLATGRIADAMRSDETVANAQVDVLTRALPGAPDMVVRLIRDNWLPGSHNDVRSWSVIQWMSPWTDDALSIALEIIGRTDISTWAIDHTAGSVAVEQPVVALQLVRARLDRDLDAAVSQSAALAAAVPSLPKEGVSPEEQVAWHLAQRRSRDPVRNLFENSNDWDRLSGIAEKWPHETLDAISPWFTRALEDLDRLIEHGHRVGFPLGLEADFRFKGENDLELPEGSILGALRIAVEVLADTNPHAFRSWIAKNEAIALTPVQRLIAHGIAHQPKEYAKDGLEFILGDTKRYFLGSVHDLHGTTKRMVAAVSPHWTSEQVRRFEDQVRSFAPPAPADETDPKRRMQWRHMMRRTQLDLLRALPARERSPEAARQVDEDERRYGRQRSGASFSGARYIGSVIEADGMAKASDDDIVNAFVELPDATGWDNPKRWMAGGNIQLARAFATFAKDHAERSIRILSRLNSENGTRAAAYAIDALSEAAPPKIVFDLVRDAVARGFDGEEFRHSVARALDRMAGRAIHVDEDLLQLLESWIRNPRTEIGEDGGDLLDPDDDDTNEEADIVEWSSLWNDGKSFVFPGGDVPVADAIVSIRLRRGQADQALDFLSSYLDSEKDIRAWDIIAQYLPYLSEAEPDRRLTFLDRLFTEVRGVVGSRAYAQFLARAHDKDHAFVEQHIDAFREATSRVARQAYGEIVALDALVRPYHAESVRRLEEIIGDPMASPAQAGAVLSAAHVFVEEASGRANAAALLARSLRSSNPDAWTAILEVFRLSDELAADEATCTVLRAVADGLPKSPKLDATFVVDRLATLLPHHACLVGQIALGLVAKWSSELGDVRTSTAMVASALIDLAITLHRLRPETREIGLRLFEQLIDIDAHQARQTLDEIDNRFRQNALGPRPRVRRRSEVAPRSLRHRR